MRTPEDDALRSVMHEWHEATINQEKMTQTFIKDALVAIFEGMLTLDARIASLAGQEWKGFKQMVDLQNEMNEQRYKMILLQRAIAKTKGEF
jgi:hypothetical protein